MFRSVTFLRVDVVAAYAVGIAFPVNETVDPATGQLLARTMPPLRDVDAVLTLSFH